MIGADSVGSLGKNRTRPEATSSLHGQQVSCYVQCVLGGLQGSDTRFSTEPHRSAFVLSVASTNGTWFLLSANGTTVDQFQRGPANPRSISANDRDARSVQFNNATRLLRTASSGCRSTSSRGSTESIRATATQAKAQALRPTGRTKARSQTPNPKRAYEKLSAIRCIDRTRLANSPSRTLPEIPDRNLAKLHQTGLTADCGVTDAAKRIFFVREPGPSAAGC